MPRRRPTAWTTRGGRPSELEFERTVRHVLRLKGESRLLEGAPVLRRAIELRNPYVAALSELQLDLLGRLRAGGTSPTRHASGGSCS